MKENILQEAENRERELWTASQKYVNEGIELEELEKIENTQSENLKNAIVNLSRKDVKQRLFNKIYKALGLSHLKRVNILLA